MKPDCTVSCDWRSAVNFDDRAPGARIELLVIHYTGMQSEQGALDWLCCEESRVSCHYFVFSDGRVVQSVHEAKRAWHAGVSSWRGMGDLNSRSIGIEIANPGHEFGYVTFPAKQMRAVIALCADIVQRNAIAPRDVVAHSDIAPLRKQDPGEKFAWNQLARHGVGRMVAPSKVRTGLALQPGDRDGEHSQAVTQLQADLQKLGYGIEITGEYDALTKAVVTAFQRHYRPTLVDGIADPATRRTIAKLLYADGVH